MALPVRSGTPEGLGLRARRGAAACGGDAGVSVKTWSTAGGAGRRTAGSPGRPVQDAVHDTCPACLGAQGVGLRARGGAAALCGAHLVQGVALLQAVEGGLAGVVRDAGHHLAPALGHHADDGAYSLEEGGGTHTHALVLSSKWQWCLVPGRREGHPRVSRCPWRNGFQDSCLCSQEAERIDAGTQKRPGTQCVRGFAPGAPTCAF